MGTIEPDGVIVVVIGWKPWRYPDQQSSGFAAYPDGDVGLAARDGMLARSDDSYDFIVRHVEIPEPIARDEERLDQYLNDHPELWVVPE